MTQDKSVTAFPLCWPEGWRATPPHRRDRGYQFRQGPERTLVTLDRARRLLSEELNRLGATQIVLSSNLPVRGDGQLRAGIEIQMVSFRSDGEIIRTNASGRVLTDAGVLLRAVDSRLVAVDDRVRDGAEPGGRLIAAVLIDILGDGISMIYSFYDPDEAERSLGTFMILDNIARVRRLGLPFLYLGYWVRGSRKMDYKARFLPQERLTAEGWTLHRNNGV